MVRRTNNPKKKCGYKRCKWPRLKYKKYCGQHEEMFLDGTPLMRTFSQIVADNKTKPTGMIIATEQRMTKIDEKGNISEIQTEPKSTFKSKIRRFIFK